MPGRRAVGRRRWTTLCVGWEASQSMHRSYLSLCRLACRVGLELSVCLSACEGCTTKDVRITTFLF